MTNDFFSNSQRLNFMFWLTIWLTISRSARLGQLRRRELRMSDMLSKFGAILLHLMEAVCVH